VAGLGIVSYDRSVAKSDTKSRKKPAKDRVLSIRISADEARELDELANKTGTPVSALVRDWIAAGLAQHRTDSVTDLFDFIAQDLQRLRALIR
jgi:predicted DNA-binding protein